MFGVLYLDVGATRGGVWKKVAEAGSGQAIFFGRQQVHMCFQLESRAITGCDYK